MNYWDIKLKGIAWDNKIDIKKLAFMKTCNSKYPHSSHKPYNKGLQRDYINLKNTK